MAEAEEPRLVTVSLTVEEALEVAVAIRLAMTLVRSAMADSENGATVRQDLAARLTFLTSALGELQQAKTEAERYSPEDA